MCTVLSRNPQVSDIPAHSKLCPTLTLCLIMLPSPTTWLTILHPSIHSSGLVPQEPSLKSSALRTDATFLICPYIDQGWLALSRASTNICCTYWTETKRWLSIPFLTPKSPCPTDILFILPPYLQIQIFLLHPKAPSFRKPFLISSISPLLLIPLSSICATPLSISALPFTFLKSKLYTKEIGWFILSETLNALHSLSQCHTISYPCNSSSSCRAKTLPLTCSSTQHVCTVTDAQLWLLRACIVLLTYMVYVIFYMYIGVYSLFLPYFTSLPCVPIWTSLRCLPTLMFCDFVSVSSLGTETRSSPTPPAYWRLKKNHAEWTELLS